MMGEEENPAPPKEQEQEDAKEPEVAEAPAAPLDEVSQDDQDIEQDEEYQAQVRTIATEEVLLSRLESLIFAYPEPISVRRLARVLCLDGKRVRELVQKLTASYEGRGILLSEVSGGFQFHTNPENAPIVRAAIKIKPMRMSRPALETLAIVAYRQPITRVDIEEIRRVDSGGTLKFLFEKGLVRVLGRKEEPGRPMIYGTTAEFLALFGLKSLADLPSLHEFTELWDEHRELVDEQEPEPELQDKPEPMKP
ncbi:MAG: SMC-Scp complex subunit ScpB [Proteobacteria bacterium]|jgi:segregation and condensation protein B|nr:SMC-Scp complex subunit ScpB [Pseudomonadota bacterium]